MMKNEFHLSAKERNLEIVLLVLAFITFIIIGKGIYNEKHNINQDNILLPLIMFIYGIFFLIYSFNGFFKGQLLGKWTPFFLVPILAFIIKKIAKVNIEKAIFYSRIFFSLLALVVSLICFLIGFKEL